jgi:hypothetical protein
MRNPGRLTANLPRRLVRLARRAPSGPARERSEIGFAQQTSVDERCRPSSLSRPPASAHRTRAGAPPGGGSARRHQLLIALVGQLGIGCTTSGPALSTYPVPPLQSRDHVRQARQGAVGDHGQVFELQSPAGLPGRRHHHFELEMSHSGMSLQLGVEGSRQQCVEGLLRLDPAVHGTLRSLIHQAKE